MPWVEVWVDCPEECNGTCDKSYEMAKRRDCAFGFIVEGKLNEAIDVLLRGDLPENYKITKEAQGVYNAWARGELDGFDGPTDPSKYYIKPKEKDDV